MFYGYKISLCTLLIGTTDQIREKLLQHGGLQDLVGRAAGGSSAAAIAGTVHHGGMRHEAIDEGVAVYLQMLQPRPKSPPRFPD